MFEPDDYYSIQSHWNREDYYWRWNTGKKRSRWRRKFKGRGKFTETTAGERIRYRIERQYSRKGKFAGLSLRDRYR